MDILFLSLRYPYPPMRGDRIRSFYLLRGLAARHRVSLVTFYEDPSEVEADGVLRELCARVFAVPFSRTRGRLNAAMGALGRDPLQNRMWYSPTMQRTIDEALDAVGPDTIQAGLFRTGQYVADAPIPKLLDLGDAMALNLERRRQLQRNPVTRWLVGIEGERVRRYEPYIARRFTRTTMISPCDRSALMEVAPDLRLDVLPNGVDLDYFSPDGARRGLSVPTILFTGTMDYFPNTDAGYYLAEAILPRVRRQIPDARLLLVGTDPPRGLVRLSGAHGVVVTGRVPDVRPYFEQATLFVAPLRCGTGLQNKVLESMAMRVPVVTTRLGASGIVAEPGRDFVLADEADDIASEVVRLLGDADAREALATNGRAYVEREHRWATIGETLTQFHEQMAARPVNHFPTAPQTT
ncbi:glycosyltransferase [Candidatus Poribacteria bacterium]|nr:glycosyltransferase [Candidatus Poribacteria bacterium]